MNAKWVRLAGDLLELAADTYSNKNCNDWSWPADWAVEEQREMATAMVADNEHTTPTALTPEQLEEVANLVESGPPDWWVMRFLSRQLQR